MSIPVQTYCDVVARLKELFTALGLEYWYVYFEEWYYNYDYEIRSIFHTEKEPCLEVSLGHTDIPHVVLIVDDSMSLFIQEQRFYFSRYENDKYQTKLHEWRTGIESSVD